METSGRGKKLDDFLILSTLGEGFTGKVRLGRHTKTGALFALKTLDYSLVKPEDRLDILNSLKKEAVILRELDHPHLVHFHGFEPNGTFVSRKGSRIVSYVVLEFAPKGEIFDVIAKSGPLSAQVARHYLLQLISALEYLAGRGIAHRDIKPENLLLDAQLNLKLVDFGFSTRLTPNRKNATYLGTKGYMSPELLAECPYDAIKSDIFAVGIVLFIFVMGYPPFLSAENTDPRYLMYVRDPALFWKSHEKRVGHALDSDFVQLFQGMTHPDPSLRLGFTQIRESQWLKKAYSPSSALEEMIVVHQRCQEAMSVECPDAEAQDEVEGTRASRELSSSVFRSIKITEESETPSSCFLIKTTDILGSLEEVRRQAEESELLFESSEGGVIARFKNSSTGS